MERTTRLGRARGVQLADCLLVASLLVASSTILLAGPSGAQDSWAEEWFGGGDAYSTPYGRTGVYIGIGGHYAMEDFDRPAIKADDTSIDGEDTGGLDLRLGYRFQPHFAAEILFQYYDDFEIDSDPGPSDSFGGWSLTLNGKAYPWLGRLQPYALIGMGGIEFLDKRGDDAGFLARLGGGLDVYITDAIVLDLEAAYALPAHGDLDKFPFATFSAGITYRY